METMNGEGTEESFVDALRDELRNSSKPSGGPPGTIALKGALQYESIGELLEKVARRHAAGRSSEEGRAVESGGPEEAVVRFPDGNVFEVESVDRIWGADVFEVRTPSGTIYLADSDDVEVLPRVPFGDLDLKDWFRDGNGNHWAKSGERTACRIGVEYEMELEEFDPDERVFLLTE